MKKNSSIPALITILALVVISCGLQTGLSSRTRGPQATQPSIPTQPGGELVSDFTPCEGAPSGKVATPQAGRVLIAHSTDGIHFKRPKNAEDAFLMDRVGVPDGVVLPSGRILFYFVDGCRPGEDPNNTGIGVAISDQHGAPKSWSFRHVKTSTLPNDEYSGAFDPNVVLLPDGSILMFATAMRTKPTGNQEIFTTHSFRSTDGGVTFEYEGLRYEGVLDPENYRFSDKNWQIITADPNHRQIGWAMSTDDGNTFKSIGAFPGGGYPWEIAAMDKPGAYRVYVGATGQDITSFYSDAAPWTTWTKDPGYRLQLDTTTGLESCGIAAPVVLKLAPGNYLMFYLTTIPGCSCGEDPTCS